MVRPEFAFLRRDTVTYSFRSASNSAVWVSGRGGPNGACEVSLTIFRVPDRGSVHSMTYLSPLMLWRAVGTCVPVVRARQTSISSFGNNHRNILGSVVIDYSN